MNDEMVSHKEVITVKNVTADPSALGLFGLAMVTLVAATQKLGWTTGVSFIIPWALFLGSIAQLIAAIYDFKKNNVFGATAFGAYALFWMAVATSWLIKMGAFGTALMSEADSNQLGVAYVGYLIFTLFMTIGAMEANKTLFYIFVLIDVLFLGLALSTFGIAYEATHTMAGWAELGIALLSFYGSAGNVLNAHFGRKFIPLGVPFGILK